MGPVLRDAAVQAMTLAPDSLLERAPGAGLAVATTPERTPIRPACGLVAG